MVIVQQRSNNKIDHNNAQKISDNTMNGKFKNTPILIFTGGNLLQHVKIFPLIGLS